MNFDIERNYHHAALGLLESMELDYKWRRSMWRTLLTPEQNYALLREGVGSWETAREYFQNNWNGELFEIQKILDGIYGALGGPDPNPYKELVKCHTA
jgi:hypothetical protein